MSLPLGADTISIYTVSSVFNQFFIPFLVGILWDITKIQSFGDVFDIDGSILLNPCRCAPRYGENMILPLRIHCSLVRSSKMPLYLFFPFQLASTSPKSLFLTFFKFLYKRTIH